MLLHITNGDHAADLIDESGLSGDVLPWRDVLHEGPVPAGLSLEALAPVRARFGALHGWGAYEEILKTFRARNAALSEFRRCDEVILWFEHDLYDQLQILQLLDWFCGRKLGTTHFSMICIGAFPGIADFRGLGQLQPAQLNRLFGSRIPVTSAMLALGRRTWCAFTAPDPTAIVSLLGEEASRLPFLVPALYRYFAEFPALDTGLTHTERTILRLVAAGVTDPTAVFSRSQDLEAAPFMGDLTFWNRIDALCSAPSPLLTASVESVRAAAADDALPGIALAVTAPGHDVLAGRADRIALNGIDEWRGGAHLVTAHHWRWDADRQVLGAHAN